MRDIKTASERPPQKVADRVEQTGAKNGAPELAERKINILIVDDRPDKLMALEAILSDLNQNVVTAKSGKEALRKVLDHDFAVILLDVVMPGMDGFETAAMIRKRLNSEHTPIIFVTSLNDSENHIAKGYSLGAVDYMMTPIIPEVLKAKVSVFVELYKKTEQIKQQAARFREMEEAEHQRQLSHAEDRLEQETKRNRFFNLSIDLLAIADFEGYMLQLNPSWQKTLGFSEDELKSRPGLEFVHPDDKPAMQEQLNQLKSGESTYFEGRYCCKNGVIKWLGWTAAPFVSERLIYIFAREITARKVAEGKIGALNTQLQERVGELTQINKELEAFSYSISHDLRAPIRSMQGFAHALIEEEKLSESGKDYAARITHSARYMDQLINDLLDYSMLGRTALARVPVNVEAVVAEVLLQVTDQIREKKANCVVRSPLHPVLANPSTLSRVLLNLISNGLKFVAPEMTPRIEISTESRGDSVRICVKDNGIGIAPEYQERIFGLFERLHTHQSYPGTGIGLALVRKGIERMGGHTGIESSIGNGSRFFLDLPALSDTATVPASHAEAN
ncbi:MAG: ATP-binding protein [Verrucomicrobiota bacterium]